VDGVQYVCNNGLFDVQSATSRDTEVAAPWSTFQSAAVSFIDNISCIRICQRSTFYIESVWVSAHLSDSVLNYKSFFSLPLNTNYSVSQKNVRHFYIFDNFTRSGLILITFFTVKFRRDLWRKTELKLTGNATTDLMAGDSINLNFLHGSFLNLTVEKLRKFVKVIAKIKVVNFF